jgi:hypothetical protein
MSFCKEKAQKRGAPLPLLCMTPSYPLDQAASPCPFLRLPSPCSWEFNQAVLFINHFLGLSVGLLSRHNQVRVRVGVCDQAPYDHSKLLSCLHISRGRAFSLWWRRSTP